MPLQQRPQLLIIVDFTIMDEPQPPVTAGHRLARGWPPDNFQPTMPQTDAGLSSLHTGGQSFQPHILNHLPIGIQAHCIRTTMTRVLQQEQGFFNRGRLRGYTANNRAHGNLA